MLFFLSWLKHLFIYLVKLAAGAKSEDKQVSVRVCRCKMLPIWTTFAVKQRSVALALNLSTGQRKRRGPSQMLCSPAARVTAELTWPTKICSSDLFGLLQNFCARAVDGVFPSTLISQNFAHFASNFWPPCKITHCLTTAVINTTVWKTDRALRDSLVFGTMFFCLVVFVFYCGLGYCRLIKVPSGDYSKCAVGKS